VIGVSPAALFVAVSSAAAFAQKEQTLPGSKIICWSDKSGKVVGCGDKVPPEYQDSAQRELSKRGIVIQQSGPALTAEQKRAQQAEIERKKIEDQKVQEQRRRDKALLETFSNEKEVELKRSRDVQLLEDQIEILQSNLKAAIERHTQATARSSQFAKNKTPVPGVVQDEIERSSADKTKFERQIAEKRQEIKDTNARYEEIKIRFRELRGADAPVPAADRRPH
jgi:hypothetical protein